MGWFSLINAITVSVPPNYGIRTTSRYAFRTTMVLFPYLCWYAFRTPYWVLESQDWSRQVGRTIEENPTALNQFFPPGTDMGMLAIQISRRTPERRKTGASLVVATLAIVCV
jgi:hypothetical protein